MSLRHASLMLMLLLVTVVAGCTESSRRSTRRDLADAEDADLAVSGSSDLASSTSDGAISSDMKGGTSGPPYTVTTSNEDVEGATLTVYRPTLPTGQKAPLVLWKHGYLLATSDYDALCRAIAAAGFVVVGVDTGGSFLGGPTNAEERDATIAALNWAVGSGSSVAAIIAGQPIAIGGHSRGGKVAVMVAAADSRIDAALLLDPVNGCGPGQPYSTDCPDVTETTQAGALTIPVGVAGETNNATGGLMPCAPTDQNYATIYAALTGASWAVSWTFTGADHMDFTDTGGGSVGALCPDGPGDDAAIRTAVRTISVAFFRRHLLNETALDAQLTGSSVPSGITVVGP